MKKIYILLLLLFSITLLSQNEKTISGYVKNKKTGETIIGAKVYVKGTKKGSVSNAYGFYSVSLESGDYELQTTAIGFKKLEKAIKLNQNLKLDIELDEFESLTEEITITAQSAKDNVESVQMSTLALSTATMEKMPALLGEVDVIKSIQLLPGVSTVGEGATGFNVRGGGIDQNLVLLDESPVYNSSHLFGFFSVFNPDAVKDVKLITGGIPAEYGGRLSSILDVRLKEGNTRRYQIDGGVGAIFSRFSFQGPIVTDKASFIIAGRRSYIDVLAGPFLDEGLADSKFYFYDLTAKANWKIDDDNTVFLSGYFGRDVFGSGFEFNWGNQTGTLRWNHLFSDKLFSNLTYYYSNYDYALKFGQDDLDKFEWNSEIITNSVKLDFNYFSNVNNDVKFGTELIYYDFVPGNAVGVSDGISVPISLAERFATQFGLYFDHENRSLENITFRYGLRLSGYKLMAPGNEYTYGDTTLGAEKPLLQTNKIGDDLNPDYINFEPRVSLKYQLSEENSIKLSYNRMAQYLHLLSNTAAATPLDLWVPSSNNVKPQIADQVALGYFHNFSNNDWETSVETYYKTLDNQIDYRSGADLLLNEFFERDLLYGTGRTYGVEFYIKKNYGDLTGWISYTLARTERQIEGINKNEWFPNRFDKTHNLNLVVFYELNKKWTFSSNFIFASGTPSTFPTNRFEWQGYYIPQNYDNSRNNYRIPAYHRLDIAATYKPFNEADDWWKGEWVFSIFNVYNRRNPFSVYFRNNEVDFRTTEAVRLAIFGSIIPAISYNFNFDLSTLVEGK